MKKHSDKKNNRYRKETKTLKIEQKTTKTTQPPSNPI